MQRNTKIYLRKIVKKIIISTILIGTLLFTLTPSVQAKQELFKLPIPTWFSQAIKPFQNALEALTGKVDNHETRIAELEKKVADLEEKIRQIESRWTTSQPANNGLSIEGGGSTLIGSNESQGDLNIGSQSNEQTLKLTIPENTSGVKIGEQYQLPVNQSQTQNCTAVGVNGEPLPSNGQLIPADQVTVVCE